MGKWITRELVHVGRVACPWQIKHYIDPLADFIFAPADDISDIVAKENAIPFDASGVELGHHGKDCSFETIIEKYNIEDPIVNDMARMINSADISDDIDASPEARG